MFCETFAGTGWLSIHRPLITGNYRNIEETRLLVSKLSAVYKQEAQPLPLPENPLALALRGIPVAKIRGDNRVNYDRSVEQTGEQQEQMTPFRAVLQDAI